MTDVAADSAPTATSPTPTVTTTPASPSATPEANGEAFPKESNPETLSPGKDSTTPVATPRKDSDECYSLWFDEQQQMNPDLVKMLRSMVKSGAKLVEFRMPLPLEMSEYQAAQLYLTARASREGTGGGEGVEILQNEPYDDDKTQGQVTHKIYHVASITPRAVRAVISKDKLALREHAWNSYPTCRTYSTHDSYAKDFRIEVITRHLAGNSTESNALGIPEDLLAKRDVIDVDIAAPVKSKAYVKGEDPTLWKSEKTGRGPLPADWAKTQEPIMTAYKLVCIKFKWFGLQNLVQNFLVNYQKGVLVKMHRQLTTSMDEWHGMSLEDVRAYEDETKAVLAEQIKTSEKKQYGHVEEDS